MSAATELEQLRDQMLEKLYEMKDLIHQAPDRISARATSYWLAEVEMALTKDHDYMGGSMVDCQDTINELKEEELCEY